MSRIRVLCNEIEEHLKQLRPRTASLLQPGLSEGEFRDLTSSLPFSLPRSVLELYQWHDGVPWDGRAPFGDMWIFEIFFPVPLKLGMESYSGLVETNADFPDFWNPNWFPVFESGCGDNLAIECGAGDVEDAAIVCHRNEDGNAVRYTNLESLLETIACCYEERVIDVSDDGDDVLDWDRLANVERRLNPGIGYWESKS